MKNYVLTLLLALLVVLTGITLRRTSSAIGSSPAPWPPGAAAIGSSPAPWPLGAAGRAKAR